MNMEGWKQSSTGDWERAKGLHRRRGPRRPVPGIAVLYPPGAGLAGELLILLPATFRCPNCGQVNTLASPPA